MADLKPPIRVPTGACACDITSGKPGACTCTALDLPRETLLQVMQAKFDGGPAEQDRIIREGLAKLHASGAERRAAVGYHDHADDTDFDDPESSETYTDTDNEFFELRANDRAAARRGRRGSPRPVRVDSDAAWCRERGRR